MNTAKFATTLAVVLGVGCSPMDGGACIVTRAEMRAADPVESWLESWNAMTRVKSMHRSTEADSSVRLAWRYDAEGRVLAYAGLGPGMYDNFQHDYVYDGHGNPTDFKLTYPQRPDLSAPSTAEVWMGTSYVNEYDAAGRLLSSTATPYGPGNASNPAPARTSFQEDSDGRCERQDNKHEDGKGDWVELRTYDSAGRLHTSERDYMAGWRRCVGELTVYEYDAQGRVLSATTQGAPGHDCDGMLLNTATYKYAVDGGMSIEMIDYATDLPNDEIIVNGVAVAVGHSIETRTAACAAIEAQIGKRSDSRCTVN